MERRLAVAELPGGPARDHPIYRLVHPTSVADLVEVKHALPGRLRLALRRNDDAAAGALLSALRGAGGALQPGASAASLVVRYDQASVDQEALLSAPLPPLPPPPPRAAAEALLHEPIAAVWAALTDVEGPPWNPPEVAQVVPLDDPPTAWRIEVHVGPWTLPHHMAVIEETPPTVLELGISGKLQALVRYDLTAATEGCRLRQRLWFAVAGTPAEAALGEAIVARFAGRFAEEYVQGIARRLEQSADGRAAPE